MRNLRRWPRLLLGVVYLFAISILVTTIRNEYIDSPTSSASNNQSGGIVIGLSLVSQEPQTFLSNLSFSQQSNDWSTSFLLQSQSPIVQVFADYIALYDNAELSQYCFTSFHLDRNINVPAEVVYEIQNISTISNIENADIGTFRAGDRLGNYVFEFYEPLCLEKGNKYFVPHLFLGIVSAETYADLGFQTITGYRALEFFPFEEQRITFNLRADYIEGESLVSTRPNLDVSILQQGWIGKFEDVGGSITLSLARPAFYKILLIAFTLIMSVIILFLNNIIDEVSSFFEVAFVLLLALWAVHEVLIPNYIASSIPTDVATFTLFALVVGEIISIFIDEAINIFSKRNVKIVFIEHSNIDTEFVVIENEGLFPIDMTSWVLFDSGGNKFKFPSFILPGKKLLPGMSNPTVKVWTKAGVDFGGRENLYWGRRQTVWGMDNFGTAYLENSKGEAIHTYSFATWENE